MRPKPRNGQITGTDDGAEGSWLIELDDDGVPIDGFVFLKMPKQLSFAIRSPTAGPCAYGRTLSGLAGQLPYQSNGWGLRLTTTFLVWV